MIIVQLYLPSVNLQVIVDLGRAQQITWFLDLELDRVKVTISISFLGQEHTPGGGHLVFYFYKLNVARFWKSRNLEGLLK